MSADSGEYDEPSAPPMAGGDGGWPGSLTSEHAADSRFDRAYGASGGQPTSELPPTGSPGSAGSPPSAVPLSVTQPLSTQLHGRPEPIYPPPSAPPVAGAPGVPGPTRSASAPLYDSDRSYELGAAPNGPPPRYRPDLAPQARAGVPSPYPAGGGRAHPATDRHDTVGPIVRPASGWGWRALVAFVAGGLLTASGFAVAQLNRDGTATATAGQGEQTTTEAAPSTTEAPAAIVDEQPASTVPPAVGDAVEPAVSVAEVLGPSVVQITTDFGVGSGVVYGDGLILTNAHVVEGATELTVQLGDGRRLTGEVVGSEVNVDIAVVSVGAGQGLPVATLATGEQVRVGQTAIAIGSPFSLQQTVTEGIVSAVNRPVFNVSTFTAMIQTDAPINPGNSGGALADVNGRVVGINTAIQTDGSSITNAGVGFAVPIDTAVSVADRLVAGIPIEPGFLGISGATPTDGSAGVEVTEVTTGSGAEAVGLLVGDRIIAIDGAPVAEFEELAGLIVAYAPGDTVDLEVVRDGEPVTIRATLGSKPADG